MINGNPCCSEHSNKPRQEWPLSLRAQAFFLSMQTKCTIRKTKDNQFYIFMLRNNAKCIETFKISLRCMQEHSKRLASRLRLTEALYLSLIVVRNRLCVRFIERNSEKKLHQIFFFRKKICKFASGINLVFFVLLLTLLFLKRNREEKYRNVKSLNEIHYLVLSSLLNGLCFFLLLLVGCAIFRCLF